MSELTRVELTWLKNRIENWIRFSRIAETHVIDSQRRVETPQRRWNEALAMLGKLAAQHKVELISIGNGTASRETDKLATELVKLLPDLKMSKIVVSEAGASVYSASAYASEELPDLDVTLRGAVSIARRLQDPLAELVKIDPKSIGVPFTPVREPSEESLRRFKSEVQQGSIDGMAE